MLLVGITGGVATGKSLVTRLLHARGATVFSADQAARAVLTPQGATLAEIRSVFGADALFPDGTLNRQWLAARVFADEEARQQLNRITHPPILRLLRAQIDAARDDLPPATVVVVEVPLLFETKMQAWFERILVVTASESVQVARLHQRNGFSAEEARQRIAAQMPLAQKIAFADEVIDNSGDVNALQKAVANLWPQLEKRAKRT